MSGRRYCAICEVIVTTCEHFDEPSLKTLSPAKKENVEPQKSFSDESLFDEPRVILVEEIPPPEIPRVTLISFSLDMCASYSSATINVDAQTSIRPIRLVYGGEPERFKLLDLKIGKNSQFHTLYGSGMAFENFPPHPENGEPIDNLRGIDCCPLGMMMSMTIQNISKRNHPFSAVVYAEIL